MNSIVTVYQATFQLRLPLPRNLDEPLPPVAYTKGELIGYEYGNGSVHPKSKEVICKL